MNIGSGMKYPANSLSNFAPHEFIIDDIKCNSMEGFLQSLKFKNPDMQKQVCLLVGKQAKFKGKNKKWWKDYTLYWQGKEIDRLDDKYQMLLNRAFIQLSNNNKFRKALLASYPSVLKHTIGKNDPKRTILTVNEFCYRLTKLRTYLLDNDDSILNDLDSDNIYYKGGQ